MGEFTFSSSWFPNKRFICRYERWQNAHKTIRSSFWRKIGK